MMNTLRIALITSLLAFSTSVFAVSIDNLKPNDGDSVKLSGFTVTMDISDLPENYSYSILIMVEVWDGANYQWNCDGAAHPAGHYDGTNVKYLVPDVYFVSDEPSPAELHVVAKVGPLVNAAHQGSYPAAIGDQIRVKGFIYGWAGSVWHQDTRAVVLTVK
jgi:hypothetical protein